MAEEWIIRVLGKEYGPADLATLHEWKSEGRVVPNNPAREVDVDLWKTAGEIPGLFRVEPPPVQIDVEARVSRAAELSRTAADTDATTISKPPSRNVLTETFRIYFRGFFQFVGLALLSALPWLCGTFVGMMLETRADLNAELRANVAEVFTVCMWVLTLVLWPIYVAGIQILSAELSAGRRVTFLSVLNHAVKYWPRVAGLCIFVYVVFVLLIGFGLGVVLLTLTGALTASVFTSVVALILATLQIWLFCRFFVFVLFWQQFAVLENRNAFESLNASSRLAHSGRDLPWYQRPLWRGAVIVSLWTIFILAIVVVATWPRLSAEWPIVRDFYNQLSTAPDPQALLQKMMNNLPKEQLPGFSEISFSVLQRILQPLLGIAFVVLYLDSKREDEN
jgi:hypothetical protein